MQFTEKINTAIGSDMGLLVVILLVICVALAVMVVILFNRQRRLKLRVDYFLRGARGSSLEENLREVYDDNQRMKEQLRRDINELSKINEYVSTAYRKIGVVKYNAFPGMAGKMSSAVALLNNEDSGIVINTMHGQEGCYTYVKEILNGKSINPLTKEDEEALKKALQMQL